MYILVHAMHTSKSPVIHWTFKSEWLDFYWKNTGNMNYGKHNKFNQEDHATDVHQVIEMGNIKRNEP